VVEQRFRNVNDSDRIQADPGGSTKPEESIASGSTRRLAHPREGADQAARDFLDAILCGLLGAQATWIATRDPAALRRELIALLAALG
jgi:hypothetical protein